METSTSGKTWAFYRCGVFLTQYQNPANNSTINMWLHGSTNSVRHGKNVFNIEAMQGILIKLSLGEMWNILEDYDYTHTINKYFKWLTMDLRKSKQKLFRLVLRLIGQMVLHVFCQKTLGPMEEIWNWQMYILEGYAVADSGLIFFQYCYNLEGDLPLFFTADEKLKKITAR